MVTWPRRTGQSVRKRQSGQVQAGRPKALQKFNFRDWPSDKGLDLDSLLSERETPAAKSIMGRMNRRICTPPPFQHMGLHVSHQKALGTTLTGASKSKTTGRTGGNRHPFSFCRHGKKKKQNNGKKLTTSQHDGVTIWQETCWKIHFHVFLSLMSQKSD